MRDKPIRDALIRGAGALGLHVVKRTRRADVAELIADLRPLNSGVELIRLGPDGDGGYLVPDNLDGIECAFSPGVSTESGFEADLARRGIRVHLADYSVDGPAESSPEFVFEKKFLGSYPSSTTMTMDDWVGRSVAGSSSSSTLSRSSPSFRASTRSLMPETTRPPAFDR